MIAAALTIVRGRLTSRAKRAPGRMASFERWDDFVRQAVAWIGREIRPGKFEDPMNTVVASQADDPEREALGELLRAWWKLFGGTFVTTADVLRKIETSEKELIGHRSKDAEPAKILSECVGEFSERAKRSMFPFGR